MFCPACGARNSDDAKFCNQCGVRIASMSPVASAAQAPGPAPFGAVGGAAVAAAHVPPAAAPAPPVANAFAPGPTHQPIEPTQGGGSTAAPGVVAPPASAARLPTMGGGNTSVALPMSGPSPRTMALAGVGIALVGIALGAMVAWRAFRRPAEAPRPLPPETNVALVELPRALPGPDSGAGAEPSRAGQHGTAVASAGGSHRGATGGTGSAGGGSGAGGAASGGSAPAGTGNVAANTGGGAAGSGTRNPATGSGAAPSGGGTSGGSTATRPGTTGGSGGSTSSGSSPGGAAGGVDPGLTPSGPRRGGYVEGDETDATGRMDPAVFSFVYRHFRSQIASCHSMVSRAAEVVGTMRVRVRVGTDGHVVRTRVMSNTTENDTLATCVQNQIRNWRYPQPEGGEVEFDYNFGFGN